MIKKKIAVVGLGKLGLCTALCLAKKGNIVTGYDESEYVVNNIKKRKFDNYEPSVVEYLKKYKSKFKCSNNFRDIFSTEIIMVVVPTPSMNNKAFSNKYIYNFLKKIIQHIKEFKEKFHVVITSTVMPGSCREFISFIEKKTKLTLNENFFLSYNPEFIALGSVIKDFENPNLVLIGSSSKVAEKELISIYKDFVPKKKISPMSLESAEITKISLNSFVTLKISFANTLLRICDKFKFANPHDVANALGKDKRISKYYFKPGLPFGGPCFPRDNEALNYFQDIIGEKNKYITNATIQANKEHVKFLNKKILNIIKKNDYKKILIYGLSFKINTSFVERSYSLDIINCLQSNKIFFKIYEKNIDWKNSTYQKHKKLLITKNKIKSKNFDLLIDVHSMKPDYNIPTIDLWNIQ
jgi:UDPglucose 6-dehydrogenase